MEIVPWTYNNPRVDRRKLQTQEFLFQGCLVQVLQNTNVEIDVNKNTAYKLWDGAFLLARHIENTKLFPKGFWKEKKCIEIGAGCGLVGQVARLLGACVTLTDLEEALPHTQNCLAANQARFSENLVGGINTQSYAWGEGTLNIDPPYDIIFGSDVIYQPSLAKCLVKAFCELSTPNTVILISYKPRGLGEEITFDLLRRKGFVIDTVAKPDHPHDFMDSDYSLLHIIKP